MIRIVNGDIFTTGAKFIAHQTNCVSQGAAGLAKTIFEKYPYANSYDKRSVTSDGQGATEPGHIEICGDGLEKRGIINMYSQYYPGKASDNVDDFDSVKNRKKWFHDCLMEISKIADLQSIALPEKIACGLAGGDWNWYFNKLQKFSEYVKHQGVIVLIYKYQHD